MRRYGFFIPIVGLISGLLLAQSPADRRPAVKGDSPELGAQSPRGSWIVLQEDAENSLVRVSADKRSVKLIASGVAGRGLALDLDGNYIIAGHEQLFRVTPAGIVSRIAAAPSGASWVQVGVDRDGSFIVADGRKTTLWRISADGTSVAALASFSEFDTESPEVDRFIALTVDASGDYLLLLAGYRSRVWGQVRFLRIKRDGSLTEVQLSGPRLLCPEGIAPDGRGAYLVTDCATHDAILRVAADGVVTRALTFATPFVGPWGIARNPVGEMVVTGHAMGQIAQAAREEGSLQEAKLRLRAPRAIVWDPKQ